MHTVCMYIDKNFYGKKVSKPRGNFTMINRLDFIKFLGFSGDSSHFLQTDSRKSS